jgi:hypothetical protein
MPDAPLKTRTLQVNKTTKVKPPVIKLCLKKIKTPLTGPRAQLLVRATASDAAPPLDAGTTHTVVQVGAVYPCFVCCAPHTTADMCRIVTSTHTLLTCQACERSK